MTISMLGCERGPTMIIIAAYRTTTTTTTPITFKVI